MALALRAKTGRDGSIKRFDVVGVGVDKKSALVSVAEGDYHVLDGTSVKEVAVSYRVVQDIVEKA